VPKIAGPRFSVLPPWRISLHDTSLPFECYQYTGRG